MGEYLPDIRNVAMNNTDSNSKLRALYCAFLDYPI
jgi:hypothetical protein